MLLVSPMISYQEKLDITMDAQRNLQGSFKEKCMRSEGVVAREVARAGETENTTRESSVGKSVEEVGGDEAPRRRARRAGSARRRAWTPSRSPREPPSERGERALRARQ